MCSFCSYQNYFSTLLENPARIMGCKFGGFDKDENNLTFLCTPTMDSKNHESYVALAPKQCNNL